MLENLYSFNNLYEYKVVLSIFWYCNFLRLTSFSSFNQDVFDFHLSDEDVAAIDKLGERNLRMCNFEIGPGGKFLFEGETSALPDFL